MSHVPPRIPNRIPTTLRNRLSRAAPLAALGAALVMAPLSAQAAQPLPTGGTDPADPTDPTEPAPIVCYVDQDHDLYGADEAGEFLDTCPSGTTARAGDCNDNDPKVTLGVVCYPDADGDGVGDSDSGAWLCAASCEAMGPYSSVPDSACPDSASDADVDAWVLDSLAAQCIQEGRDYVTSYGSVQCTNTGTVAKPKHRETQTWKITLKPEQIMMGQATKCYTQPLPTVAGTYSSGRLPTDSTVALQTATADMPEETYFNAASSASVEVVIPFKAALSTSVDYTSSNYDYVKAKCADDGTWQKATYSVGAPSTTPEVMGRLFSTTYASDDDDCFYLDLTGGITNPATKDLVYGVGTAFTANITTLDAVTTDLSECGLIIDDATAHLPTFSVFMDSTPFFGMNAQCGFDEDFAWDASDSDEKTYCSQALAEYEDGLLGAVEDKWTDSAKAKMQDGLQSILGAILQSKDIVERQTADGSSVWTVTWNSVSYTTSGITFTVTETRNELGKCK